MAPSNESDATHRDTAAVFSELSEGGLEDVMGCLGDLPSTSFQVSAFEEAMKRLLIPMEEKSDMLVKRSTNHSGEPAPKRRRISEAIERPVLEAPKSSHDIGVKPQGTSGGPVVQPRI